MKVERLHDGTKIQTDRHLAQFVEREVQIPFRSGELFYKVIAVQDFSETESVLIFKGHHALMDGVSIMQLFSSFQDKYDKDQLYEFGPKLSFLSWLLVFLCLPVSMVRAACFSQFILRKERNLWAKPGRNLSGIKKIGLSGDIDLPALKTAAKKMNTTINDFTLAALSVALQRYFRSKNDKTPAITVCFPMTMK